MSTPSNPFDPAQPEPPTQPQSPLPEGALADGQPETAKPKGRKTAIITGAVAAVALLGGGGAIAAYSALSGGGAQPESVFPSTTFAFGKVDLDPSAGQKIDAIRFIRKFPDAQAKVKEDSDLRKVVFDAIKDAGGLKDVDYAKDVEPWLGERAAFGAIPGANGQDPIPVVALAVKDKGEAEKSLPKLAKSMDGGQCRVVEDFALCAEKKEQLDAFVSATQKATLADSENFKTDLGDLGETGIVTAWSDTAKAAELLGSVQKSVPGMLNQFGLGANGTNSGRTAMALRFDGPNLELAGRVNDAKVSFVGSANAGSIAELPKGTLAAVTVANAGEQLKTAWPQLESMIKETAGEQQFTDGVAQAEQELGISIPDDVVKALGSKFSIAFGGMGADNSEIKVGLVTDGDKAVLQKLSDAAGQGMGAGGLTLKGADKDTAVALSDNWASELTSNHGLGDSKGFKDALKDPGNSRVAAYVDIAGVLAAFKDEIPAEVSKNLGQFSSLGMTVSGEGKSADFALRLTTK
ncbi:DUF3352 domain-containing protein [Knoellia koreensis]|uniref:DUF3352 domain-containing protein n=1 Tax=Knoellia koreensis TaxID=2730921 RepID=A0A849HN33_9MICO|nr:DUF3352 domain-containing protein [Knoellia sp. DB2414S]NNM48093.1 DUF3352 domain-containing protein [Knoellia sp. DB2414S]